MEKSSKYESHLLVPWRVVRSRRTYQDDWLTLRTDDCVTAHGTSIDQYHVVEQPDWVNVVALTANREVFLVRQYRHGTREICTGLPSGICDLADETPLHTAQRELMEETGLCGGSWILLRRYAANPGRQNNFVYGYLALNVCMKASRVGGDTNEVIDMLQLPWAEFISDVIAGTVELQSHHLATVLLAKEYLSAVQPQLDAWWESA